MQGLGITFRCMSSREGQSIVHTHRTFHLVGDEAELDPIAQALLGASIAEIVSALP